MRNTKVGTVTQMLADAQALRSRLSVEQKAVSGEWYQITNADDPERAHVRIYDEIGGWFGIEAEDFAAELSKITATEIEVAINSPGGSVFQGLAIFNALRTHPARIITRVDGLAASAASFIAQAGDERIMVESSQMMIHDAMAATFGNADDFREVADFLDKQSQNIAELYAARSDDHTAEHYADLMAAETWMTATEAVHEGLADRVLIPERQPSNISPQTSAAAQAAADDLVERTGVRAAYLRKLQLPEREPTS